MPKTTIKTLDDILEINSGLDWLKIIKPIMKDIEITNDTILKLLRTQFPDMYIFDFKNRRFELF